MMTRSRIARWRDLRRWLPGHEGLPDSAFPLVAIGSFMERISESIEGDARDLDALNVIAKITFGGELFLRGEKEKQGYKGTLYRALPDDLIFSKIRVGQGSLCVIPDTVDHVAVSGEYPVYRVDPEVILPGFLSLLLRTEQFQKLLQSISSGNTTKKRIHPKQFEALEVPLPDVDEQQRLVAEYAAAQAEAARLEAEADQIEADAVQAFEAALGLTPLPALPRQRTRIARYADLDRWSHEGALQQARADHSFEASYDLVRLGDAVADLKNGWSPQCLDRPITAEEWGVLKVGAVSMGHYRPEENKALPQKLEPVPGLEVVSGDVLIGRANILRLVGAAAYVRQTPSRLMLCDKIFRVEFDPEVPLDPEFLVAVLQTPALRQQIEAAATGTSPTMKNISKASLLDLLLPLPASLEEQQELVLSLVEGYRKAAEQRAEAAQKRAKADARFAEAVFG